MRALDASKWLSAVVLFSFSLSLAAPGQGAEIVSTISPGNLQAAVEIEGLCPTFSWTQHLAADHYELVVFGLGEPEEEPTEVLRREVPGGGTSWTPSLGFCLEPGARYAWSVRAVVPDSGTEWSAPRLFELRSRPGDMDLERALEVVRESLGRDLVARLERLARSDATPPEEPARSNTPTESGTATRRASPVLAAGDPRLKVAGSPVVTVATLAGALCQVLTYRWIDRLDGTVLDCHTEKIWLKDAECVGGGTWDPDGGPGSAQALLADFNAGSDFGCADYVAGTYSDWRIPGIEEWCVDDSGPTAGLCPAADAASSLIDSSVAGSPKVQDAAGSGGWSEGDAFAGVAADSYRSSTAGVGADQSWVVDLSSGFVSQDGPSNSYRVWPVRGGQ